MVKIFQNNRKFIVTTVLYIIYWSEVNAAVDTPTDEVHRFNVPKINSRRGYRKRQTTKEDRSIQLRKVIQDKEEHKDLDRQQKPYVHDRNNDGHIEKWSIEETDSSESEDADAFKTTKKMLLNENDSTNTLMWIGEQEHDMRRRNHHRNRNRNQNNERKNESPMKWLLDTIRGEDEESPKPPETITHKSKSRHKKTTTTTTEQYTEMSELAEEERVSRQYSNHNRKRKKKTTDDPVEEDNDNTNATPKKLRHKSSSKKDSNVPRARGYESQHEPKPRYKEALQQYEKKYSERSHHRGLVASSVEDNTKSKPIDKVKQIPKKLKFQTSINEEEHSLPKQKFIDEEGYGSVIPQNVYKKDHKILKNRYTEDKKKHNIHKQYNLEEEEEHTVAKHYSSRIHNDKINTKTTKLSEYQGENYHKVETDDTLELLRLKPKLHKEKKLRYPEKSAVEKEETTTQQVTQEPYEKIKDIRTGTLSREDPSSELENDAETTTKKVKLRNKSDQKKGENVNILRSTRMPSVYQLQEDHPGEETPEKEEDDHIPKLLNEELSPYAMEKQMRRFADCYIKENIANITVVVAGRTVEYNNIILLKVTEIQKDSYFRANDNNKYTDEKPEKKIIFIVHGLTVSGMKGILKDIKAFNTLINIYISFLNKFDIYIIPMANPDGYAATLNSQASGYWNKNLSPQSGCPGVVLDRNFDVAWNDSVMYSSCSHVYPGPTPFSEAETRAVRDVFHQNSHKLMAYIHVHASTYDASIFKGDAILYPRGYSDAQTDDDKYIDLKGEVEEVMKNASFQVISVAVDTLYNWYGKVSGTSVDYASSVYGIPFAMEFAMQLYEQIQHHALTEIWGRVIPVVFKSIWKSMNTVGD